MKLSKRQQVIAPVIAIAVVGLLWGLVGDLRDRAHLAEHRAKMHTAGEPASIAELTPRAVSPRSNAAVLLQRAKSDIVALENEVAAGVKLLSAAEKAAVEAGTPTESGLVVLRGSLTAHPGAIEQIIAASECLYLQPSIDYSARIANFAGQLLPFIQSERAAMRVLRYRLTVQLADGDRQGALETCLAMLRLARLTEQNPLLVGQLVAFALEGVAVESTNQVLRAGPLSEDLHEQLEAELARCNGVELFRDTLREERVRAMDRVDETMEVSLPLAWILSIFVDESEYVDFLNLAIEEADNPFREVAIELKDAEQKSGMLTRRMVPPLVSSFGALARNQAMIRCLRVFNRLLVQDPDGTKGLAIDQLGLPADAITDPYDGKPLRMMHGANGWKVYSVGQNLQDDGGRLDDQSDVGVGPIEPSP
jgi:hypothetical protein